MMATKKTYTVEITCDVCKKRENVREREPQSFMDISCATRKIGYADEYGKFHKKDKQPLLIKNLDLCPECREKAYTKIIAETSQNFTTESYYSFLSDEGAEGTE